MKKIDCSILLPTFNESRNIVPMIEAIHASLKEAVFTYEILFIDDSNDSTPQVIKDVMRRDDTVRLIHREKAERTGLATALVRGFDEAKGGYICCMDSDLQHPPELIPLLFRELSAGADMAVASRFVKGGTNEGLANIFRKIVSNSSKILTWIVLVPTQKTTDPMTGFFAFKKTILFGKTLKPAGFKILVEMLVRIKPYKVVDIPMKMRERKFDTTKATFKQGLHFFMHIAKLAYEVPDALPGYRIFNFIHQFIA